MTRLEHGVFLDLQTVDRGDLDLARLKAVLGGWRFHSLSNDAATGECIRDAQVVVTNKIALTRGDLAGARQLELICAAATGVDNIDLDAAREHGIAVCNVRDYATPSVAQHVFCLILTLCIRLDDYRAELRAGAWSQSREFCLLDFQIHELAGKTLGIVGYGVLGRAVAELGRSFGMRIAVAQGKSAHEKNKGPDRVPLAELLQQSDVISLHCPLTPETRGLIGARELASMKAGALLINTARGGLVDERALADALRDRRIGGAGVDVLSEEPPPAGHPLLAPGLPNLIVTPHIAWASVESRQRMIDELTANIEAFADHRPRNRLV